MTDLSDISPRQCCFFGWAQTLCHKQPLLFSKQAGKKKKKKDGGFAAAGVRTLWLLSLWKKKGKGKEEVGIDLQEDGHLSVCTFVLKLEGEREKKSRMLRLPWAQSLKKTSVIFPRDTPVRTATVERRFAGLERLCSSLLHMPVHCIDSWQSRRLQSYSAAIVVPVTYYKQRVFRGEAVIVGSVAQMALYRRRVAFLLLSPCARP